jgi:glycosyltransferase involved in cell wall biosynthesis
MVLKEYKTLSGEILLYIGNPNTDMFEELIDGYGDIWHSSFEQGYKNAFPDIVIQGSVLFWYINDFDGLDQCVSWRINPNQFAIRKTAWEILGGFDTDYENIQIQAFDFGFNALRNQGATPLYIKGLFNETATEKMVVSARDRYAFFRKNFKMDHSFFMIYRKGFWKPGEWNAFSYARKHFKKSPPKPLLPPRKLKEVNGTPTVSYIIPTMFRQKYTLQLLKDLADQEYKPNQVFVVDATPESERDDSFYDGYNFPYELSVIWQTSKGSCRARNEAIVNCTGDYIVFGDDDIRIPADFIKNHIRLIQTYNAGGCNGLDIKADHADQDLNDLKEKLKKVDSRRWFVGSTQMFSNANSCVKKEYVSLLVGNDINYDGGYGEDGDFGLSLIKLGVPVLHNPFSTNLHLKPSSGGYRFWGTQARIMGKKRKTQPWELDTPVKWVRPVPSPTLMYQYQKHFTPQQVIEYRHRYFFYFLFKGPKASFVYRLLRVPYKQLQFNKSIFYAKKLIELGVRTK